MIDGVQRDRLQGELYMFYLRRGKQALGSYKMSKRDQSEGTGKQLSRSANQH